MSILLETDRGCGMTKGELLEELEGYPDDAVLFTSYGVYEDGEEHEDPVMSVASYGYRVNKYDEYVECKRSDYRHKIGILIS